jgi:uncharacterized protein YciI
MFKGLNKEKMKQYLITGYDFTDEGALKRRMSVREDHLNGVRKLKAAGNYVLGGAMLSEDGRMIGSTMVLQFELPQELEAWRTSEIYITAKVWEKVDVQPFKVAVL